MKPTDVRTTMENWSPAPFAELGHDKGNPLEALVDRVQSLEAEVMRLRAELDALKEMNVPVKRISSIPPPPLTDDQAKELLVAMTDIIESSPVKSSSSAPKSPSTRRSSIPRLLLSEK